MLDSWLQSSLPSRCRLSCYWNLGCSRRHPALHSGGYWHWELDPLLINHWLKSKISVIFETLSWCCWNGVHDIKTSVTVPFKMFTILLKFTLRYLIKLTLVNTFIWNNSTLFIWTVAEYIFYHYSGIYNYSTYYCRCVTLSFLPLPQNIFSFHLVLFYVVVSVTGSVILIPRHQSWVCFTVFSLIN